MSSPDSISSQSSLDSDSGTACGRPSRHHRDSLPSRRSDSSISSHRPLPPPPRRSGPSHSGQMLAAILRDRALPVPAAEQTAEERRRSIIALDRKRRLTNPTYEDGRRRTNSGSFHDRAVNYAASPVYRMDGPSSPPTRGHAASDPSRPLPDIIDLTGSSPPSQPQTPRGNRPRRRSSSNSSRRYVVPKWQPDSEVSECPICKRAFTWVFRRHHCRKCGRVVCNDCSPHRITIPRQFIVHPPGPDVVASPSHSTAGGNDSMDLTGVDDDDENPFRGMSSLSRYATASPLEGGEKVRLCNPCVPDPQPDPFPNYPSLSTDLTSSEAPLIPGANRMSIGEMPLATGRVSVSSYLAHTVTANL